MGVASAVIGSALIGTGAGIFASKKAADAQEQAAERAADVSLEIDRRQRRDLAPWRETGTESLNALRKMLGLGYYEAGEPGAVTNALTTRRVPIYETRRIRNPNYETGDWDTGTGGKSRFITKNVLTGYREVPVEGAAATPAGQGRYVEPTFEPQMGEFETSPGYEFTRSEGLRAMQNALSASGRNRSGAHIKAAGQYAKDLASTEYDNYLNRFYQKLNPYLSLAGLGQTGATSSAQLSATGGRTAAGSYLSEGDARAAGYINMANALTGGMTGAGQNLFYLNALKNLPAYSSAGAAQAIPAYNPLAFNPYQMGSVGPQAYYGTYGR